MKLETFAFRQGQGWSVPKFPELDSEGTLVVVFGASEFLASSAAIQELTAAYPNAHFIGCSSAGEIFGTEIHDGSLAVAVVRFEKTRLKHSAVSAASPGESFAAGEHIAKELMAPDLRAVFVLSDGIHVNGSELVRGLNSVLPQTVVVTGGLAGDGSRFKETWVLLERKPVAGAIVAVGLFGESVIVGHGSQGGWDMFGPHRMVTKSQSNVLYELDGEPALALYKKYLGERASGLPATGLLFPLAVYPSQGDGKALVRTILAVDEEKQSITFAGDIPQGAKVQFMKANFDRLVEGALNAARVTREKTSAGEQMLSIAISCVGRRLVLGERSEEETEATLEVLPKGTRQIGFYSYGEISPYATGHCDLHNQTMTLTTISEA
ncbi:MAG: hypothetical protein A3G81_16805 [Betaproteobacteria bacterium RIFCSPLOWO2_12_FULL_65_14]|nr:MAG: hypothetical protein A3G81_16805 [Betaproteobacteria bacterium RIFCSPLOWO2_12_FULL_65_14]